MGSPGSGQRDPTDTPGRRRTPEHLAPGDVAPSARQRCPPIGACAPLPDAHRPPRRGV